MVKAFKQVDATEKRLIGMWRKRGFNIPSIAELLDRGKGTISRQVQLIKKPPKKKGRPPVLTDKTVEKLFHICFITTLSGPLCLNIVSSMIASLFEVQPRCAMTPQKGREPKRPKRM